VTGFELGGFRCAYLPVGSFDFDPEAALIAPAEELAAALAKHDLGPDKLVFQVRALLVDTGLNRVIVDPAGPWEDQHAIEPAMAREGIDPASIDTVVISHAHADHFWGAVRADGTPLFPNARYWMQKAEWQHWLSPDNPEPDHVENFRRTLLPIENRFSLAEGETEIVPGIRCLPTFGHSPGHMAVRIGEKALYTGDVLFSPPQVERPDWVAGFDVWPEQVVATRRALLDELGGSGSLVLTCHMPGSGAGRVVAEGDGWCWQPEDLG
jgi:glyoxylase-like metal-dependent hydrolase (beta-lactamase superfamily II)